MNWKERYGYLVISEIIIIINKFHIRKRFIWLAIARSNFRSIKPDNKNGYNLKEKKQL